MAFMVVEEYAVLAQDGAGNVMSAPGDLVAVQSVTVSGTSAATTNAVNAATRFVGIVSDVAVYFEFGTAPTASSATRYLPAGCLRYFIVHDGIKVAGITV